MAAIRPPEKAVFFAGILASGGEELALAAAALEHVFGAANRASRVWPFDHTDYYLKEIGPAPVRAFLAWTDPFPTDEIAGRKIATNTLERALAVSVASGLPRPINLDPGYLTPAKLVLASAKNYAHRIHLRDNIYAEVTLQYRQGRFLPLPWTFPDYASERYHPFFLELRRELETP